MSSLTSSLTDEWQLSRDYGTKYVMSIQNFDTKIKNFKTGQVVCSKTFYIGKSSFQIGIYPMGRTDRDKGNVTVFLRNHSDWGVDAKCVFSVKDFSKTIDNVFYPAYPGNNEAGCVIRTFAPRGRFTKNDLLDGDGRFTLKANIEIVWEGTPTPMSAKVPDNGKQSERDTEEMQDLTASVDNIEKNNRAQRKEIKYLKSCVANIERNHKAQEIKDLKTSVSNIERNSQTQKKEIKDLQTSVSYLQRNNVRLSISCPVCLDVVRPPMRLMQCGLGHIVCDSCYSKSQVEAQVQRKLGASCREGNPYMDLCHSCRGPVTGRPAELERILGLN